MFLRNRLQTMGSYYSYNAHRAFTLYLYLALLNNTVHYNEPSEDSEHNVTCNWRLPFQ